MGALELCLVFREDGWENGGPWSSNAPGPTCTAHCFPSSTPDPGQIADPIRCAPQNMHGIQQPARLDPQAEEIAKKPAHLGGASREGSQRNVGNEGAESRESHQDRGKSKSCAGTHMSRRLQASTVGGRR